MAGSKNSVFGVDALAAVKKVKADKSKAKSAAKKKGITERGAEAFLKQVHASAGSSKAQPGASTGSGRSTPASAPGKAAAKRVIPLGQQQRYVFDLANVQRVPLTFSAVKEQLRKDGREVSFSPELLELLGRNERLAVDPVAQTVVYKPKYAISGKAQLQALVRRHPQGLVAGELLDAYSTARVDLDELKEAQDVLECGSRELNDTIVYPNLLTISEAPDEQLRDMVCAVALPQTEVDVDEALHAAGIIKAKRSTARLKMAVITDNQKAPKEKAAPRIRRMTNAHMARELLGTGTGTIDS